MNTKEAVALFEAYLDEYYEDTFGLSMYSTSLAALYVASFAVFDAVGVPRWGYDAVVHLLCDRYRFEQLGSRTSDRQLYCRPKDGQMQENFPLAEARTNTLLRKRKLALLAS